MGSRQKSTVHATRGDDTERSNSDKDKYHPVTYRQTLKCAQMNLSVKEKQTQTKRIDLWLPVVGGGRKRDRLGVWD